MRDVIVVVPCYNEAERLPIAEFQRFGTANPRVRFLFVDDGSCDDTWAALGQLVATGDDAFTRIRLPANAGKAEAVRHGFLHAFASNPAYLGFWDADLSTPLDAIPKFCRLLDTESGIEAVIGSRVRLLGRRVHRRESRHYLGRVFATAASLVLRLPVYDTQCGAKLFRNTDRVRALFANAFRSRWIFDVEILARIIRGAGAAGQLSAADLIYELPLVEWRDIRGSKLRVRDFLRSAADLVRIYWVYFGSGAPPYGPSGKAAAPVTLTNTE